MRPHVPVAVIGGGRHAAALADHASPFPRFRITAWAAAGDGPEAGKAAALAGRVGVPFSKEWTAVAGDASIPAVLVLSDDASQHRIAADALATGKVVLCPGPVGPDLEEALGRGRGVLLAPGALRFAPGGRTALRSVAAGEVGALHSIYVAARAGRVPDGEAGERGGADIVASLGWDAFDFVLAAVDGPASRVHVRAGRLFGAGGPADTAVIICRFASDVIATMEVSRCLPPSMPADPMQAEIEIVGKQRAIHIEPFATAVRVYGRGGFHPHPWVDPPVLGMVDDVLDIVEERTAPPDGAALRRIIDVMKQADTAAIHAGPSKT